VKKISKEHIEVTPEVRGGKPHITDTRIAVEDIALMHFKSGYSLMEIAGKYDLLPASVYAAIAYYFDHKEEIDARIKEDDAFVEEFRRNNPGRLQEKLRVLRGE
jgi:uncharacterized protein (DUF433 family)